MAIIINFCPTGMIPSKRTNPYVPESPAEIVEQVHEAFEMGITIAHLHARDQNGVPAWESQIYAKIFEGIREYCPGLIICGSTSGRNFPELEKRSALLELMPDMASLTLSSMNFINTASVNSPDIILGLLARMREYGVHPEFECFDMGMINYGNYLIRKGLAEPPYYWNILLGNIAGIQAKPLHMGMALAEIPGNHHIAFAGLGNDQLVAVSMAISQGLGVRIGLEDNIWLDQNRTIPARNIDLVRRVHQLIEIHGQSLLSSAEFGKFGFYNNLVHHVA